MTRQTTLVLLLLAAACRAPAGAPPIPVVDFIKDFDRAEQRPADAFTIADRGKRSIVAPAPGRIAWTLRLPHRGRLQAYLRAEGSAPVRFRVGVSDNRTYEPLADTVVAPSQDWTAVSVDLSAYAGRKWSIFYLPDTISWRVVLSTDAVDGAAGRGAWGGPVVLTDRSGMIEYEQRRRR